MSIYHEPVLLNEVITLFKDHALLHNSGKIVDATLGFGGHTRELLENGFEVLAIESDSKTLETTKKLFEEEAKDYVNNLTIVRGNFSQIKNIVEEHKFYPVSGVLYDLGINSVQITDQTRGISFQNENADLDMRTDDTLNIKAYDLLNALQEKQLISLFEEVCGYSRSFKLAKEIVKFRNRNSIKTVGDFIKIIDAAGIKEEKINKATKPFMSLRMAVNSELENLRESLPQSFDVLAEHGVVAVITFHSLEDKIVKDYFKSLVSNGKARIIGEDYVLPSEEEISKNVRSRSAKLRCIEKI